MNNTQSKPIEKPLTQTIREISGRKIEECVDALIINNFDKEKTLIYLYLTLGANTSN